MDMVSFLAGLPHPPRLLALGEPMHGSEDILRVRNAVVRDLVMRGGFRSIAVESDFHRAPLVNDYIQGADIEVEQVLDDGLSHPYVHRLEAVSELLRWLRDINRTLDEPVRFYGFDGPMEMAAAPSPRDPLLRVHAALAAVVGATAGSPGEIADLIGDEARWTEEAAMYHAERSIGGSAEVARLRLLTDDLCGVADTAAPLLAADPERWWWLRADMRTAVGLLRYHAAMASDGAQRLSRLIAQRDVMMGEHLLAIAEREAGRGGTIVVAHNRHLQREPSTMTMGAHELWWFGGGAQVQTRLGADYRFVAIAIDIGAAPAHGLGEPGPGTVEGELYRSQRPNAQLYRGADLAERLRGLATRADRDARGAYFPLEAEHLAETDGVLFLREVRA
ncbi:Erythromycin esterase OS=Tsukamurella paurometabola (strain ATCC 8368 / DSM / CCUG 35730 / CIP 100753 / JCM 10117 / KCTC 9821 / NBRC 16120 / NCIMB 702349/ NCTC 13040) OX=521096 GN=Tpau_1168 PE=4 SV=1 [Tsukamurella paurometabola]|uniref:Erythromycin esterase n=2 Tax=Tsukamurella paurometabola TaxID=2061 RepID=D5UVZ2_TSUPD|nr:Erythromycin esterase [Tsukamurella paurometabola DSM 20162]SUP28799.1 Erythromycin esterase [Tsukamurella paurometabola]